jgi:Zinc-binding dehydrogenase
VDPATQLAVARGIRVIGTASERNHELLRSFGAVPVAYGDGLADRVRAIAPDGVDAVLDASGRGELPLSIELAGGPERVLTIAAFDAADHGVHFHMDGSGQDLVRAQYDILSLHQDGRLQVPIWRKLSARAGGSRHRRQPSRSPRRQDRPTGGLTNGVFGGIRPWSPAVSLHRPGGLCPGCFSGWGRGQVDAGSW